MALTPPKSLLNFQLSPDEDLLLALLQKQLLIHTCLCDWEAFGMDTSHWHIDLGQSFYLPSASPK